MRKGRTKEKNKVKANSAAFMLFVLETGFGGRVIYTIPLGLIILNNYKPIGIIPILYGISKKRLTSFLHSPLRFSTLTIGKLW